MKRYLPFIAAIIAFIIIHEGTHALTSFFFGEYKAFHVHFFGFEVVYQTAVEDRAGIKWGYIAGLSNIITLLIGYLLFLFRKELIKTKNAFFRDMGYWAIFVFMLFDPCNLSLIPFFFGGDIGGIVVGFGVNRILLQTFFFVVLLVNRELIIHKIFPLYGIKTRHILFRPIITCAGKPSCSSR
ncbi:MAG: hypothetical protein ACOX37_08035 [Bacillota bacterium]